MVKRSTGLHSLDAQTDFGRVRRQRSRAWLAGRLRGRPGDLDLILPFEEVVAALGRVGETDLGLQRARLETIVGTVDRGRDFDRSFRPTTGRVRSRWERIAEAQRRGQAMPPVSLIRVGDLHFVRDGHHRVSVARAQGREDIDAFVTEVRTRVPLAGDLRTGDLPLKGHERVFLERVPLPASAREEVRVSDPWAYAELAEGIEAWGFRLMEAEGRFMGRDEVARRWLEEELRPVAVSLREAGFDDGGTSADLYLRWASERYRLLRTHEWNDDVLERLRSSRG